MSLYYSYHDLIEPPLLPSSSNKIPHVVISHSLREIPIPLINMPNPRPPNKICPNLSHVHVSSPRMLGMDPVMCRKTHPQTPPIYSLSFKFIYYLLFILIPKQNITHSKKISY